VSRVYFTDRDLGKQFPCTLAEAGITVERRGDLFAPEGSDEQWFAHSGTRGRVAINHNSRIRCVPIELVAVRQRSGIPDADGTQTGEGGRTAQCRTGAGVLQLVSQWLDAAAGTAHCP
jgi:hypothetical protein